MLISTMYHHVNSDKCSNELDMLDKHLKYISEHYVSTFPTRFIPEDPICLVFDDGYYDFYKYIYPLLQKYDLKALLAVSPKYILDDCTLDDETRLNYKHDELYENYQNGTFCTYKELKQMIDSKHIRIASHSYSHKNLLDFDTDFEKEIKNSKEILENKLDTLVESFVFPYGKYSKTILDMTKQYYQYSFRIGNGVNRSFKGIRGVIYRIDADNLQDESNIFSGKNIFKYKLKSLIRIIVGNPK